MSNIIGNYVGGSRVNPADGTLQDVFNPSTGEVSGQVRLSNATDLDDTVKVASAAALEWGATPALKRAQVMFRFKRLLEENADKIATTISSEHGKLTKTLWEKYPAELKQLNLLVEFHTCSKELSVSRQLLQLMFIQFRKLLE